MEARVKNKKRKTELLCATANMDNLWSPGGCSMCLQSVSGLVGSLTLSDIMGRIICAICLRLIDLYG